MDSNTLLPSQSNSTTTNTPIEDLSLENRIKIAEEFQPFKGIQPDCLIDAKDTVNIWCMARVLKVDEKEISVTFDGWSSKYDEKREELEKVIATNFACLTTASDVTQYLRGHLYIFLDILLTSEHKEENLRSVYDFLFLIIKLIILWLKMFATTLLKPFIEYQKHPKLMLVDRNCALAACGYEILDMLKWLFCLCSRTGVFFGRYDTDIAADSGNFTKKFDSDKFTVRRDPHFDYDSFNEKLHLGRQIVYGLLINLFESFCAEDGIKAVRNIISLDKIAAQAETIGYPKYKLPFSTVTSFLYPLKGIRHIANEVTCKEIASLGKETLVKWVEFLTDKDIRDLSKEELNKQLDVIKDFFGLGYSEEETKRMIQDYEMQITLKFLQSESLEKRLNGVGDIKKMIEQTERDDSDKDSLMNWILQNNILGKVLDDNTHSEIIKRSSTIFAFLAKKSAITTDILEALWKCQQDKDEDTILAIYETIKSMVNYLPAEHIKFMYEKINKLYLNKFDDKLLTFMRNFTFSALTSALTKTPQSTPTSKVPEPIYDPTNGTLLVPNDPKLYFIPTFWSLMQDESLATQSQSLMAYRYLKELLLSKCCEEFRSQFIYLCIENLRKHRSVPQCLDLVINVINMSNMKPNYNRITNGQWIKKLRTNDNLFEVFIEDCENYEKLVKEYSRTKGKVDDNVVIVGKQSHGYNLERRLIFSEYMVLVAGEDMELGQDNLKKLCNLYIENSGCEFDTKTFLNCFSSKDEQKLPGFVFGRKETQQFFDILCESRTKLIPLGVPYYKCFATYFKLINVIPASIEMYDGALIVLDFDKLTGLEQLWNCIRSSKDQETLELFIELLISLYNNLDVGHTLDKKVEIMHAFVDRCLKVIMELNVDKEELAVTNLVKLLETMLDFDDGKKYEMEMDEGYKQSIVVSMRPSMI